MAFRYIDKAKTVTAINEIENYSLALSICFLDCRKFPDEDLGLISLWEKPLSGFDGWDGPYLTKKPGNDPWGNKYEYTVPGPHGLPFGIRSFGADAMEGGEGDDRDVCSWKS